MTDNEIFDAIEQDEEFGDSENIMANKLKCYLELLAKLLLALFLFFCRKTKESRESFGRESAAKVGKVNSAVVSVKLLYPRLRSLGDRRVFPFNVLKRRALV